METFFSTIYNWTKILYGVELDNYLYETVPGYVHVGIAMVVISLVVPLAFYYVLKPVRRQWLIWFGCVCVNAILKFAVAFGYTITPLINNEIDGAEKWTVPDTAWFGAANVMWGAVTSLLFTILLRIFIMRRWGSPAKYIPIPF